MLEWFKTTDRLPDNPNSLKNLCVIKSRDGDYFLANYSVDLNMWRHIAIPFYYFAPTNIIDEMVKTEDIEEWALING